MLFIQSFKHVCVAPVLCLKVFTEMTTVSRSLNVPQLPVKSKLKPSQHISFHEAVQEWWYLSDKPQTILHDVSLKSAPSRTQAHPKKTVLSLRKHLWLDHATETTTQASLQAMSSTKWIPTNPKFLFLNGILRKLKQSTFVLAEHPILEVEKRIYRPKLPSKYLEYDDIPDTLDSMDILFKDYGNSIWKTTISLPP
jgi:hypothetical protein